MAIHVYGTSHVAGESLDLIDEKIEKHEPDFVALELGFTRLNALLEGRENQKKGGPIFLRIIKKFQDYIGSKTGVMPGSEMLHGYNTALDNEIDVALIDREISDTVKRLSAVRRAEKVKAVAHLLLAFLIPGSVNASEIPDEGFINEMLEEFKFKFPGLYQVLVEERNCYMIESLRALQRENPEAEIVAFVGAAHRKAIQEAVDLEDQATLEEWA